MVPLTMVFALTQMPLIKRHHLEPVTLEAERGRRRRRFQGLSRGRGNSCGKLGAEPAPHISASCPGLTRASITSEKMDRRVKPGDDRDAGASSAPSDRINSALLLGDDLVLDAVVGLLRHDLLLHQLVLALVGPALDDRGGIGLADAGQFVELVGGGGVDVEQFVLGARSWPAPSSSPTAWSSAPSCRTFRPAAATARTRALRRAGRATSAAARVASLTRRMGLSSKDVVSHGWN